MFSGNLLSHIPQTYIYTVATLLFTWLTGVVYFVLKLAYGRAVETLKKGQDDLADTKTLLTALNTEVTLQRTNCLTTLQIQGEKQIQILERIAESVSYLKGKTDQ